MARQTNHPKASPITHRKSNDHSKSHVTKPKPSKTKANKVTKVATPLKNSQEHTKKYILVKPITKNEVRKLQNGDKHAPTSHVSKHTHVVESSAEPGDLLSALHDSLGEAKTHILKTGKAAFDEVHAVLIQTLDDRKANDRSFLKNVLHNTQSLSAPLSSEKIETTVQRKSRRVSEVVEIGQRVAQFRQSIEDEENKLDDYWKQYESLQQEFIKFAARVFGGHAVGAREEDEGYLNDIRLLDAEHATQVKVLLEEVDEVGQDAIKKMKASEKDIDVKKDKVRQRIVGAMMW